MYWIQSSATEHVVEYDLAKLGSRLQGQHHLELHVLQHACIVSQIQTLGSVLAKIGPSKLFIKAASIWCEAEM